MSFSIFRISFFSRVKEADFISKGREFQARGGKSSLRVPFTNCCEHGRWKPTCEQFGVRWIYSKVRYQSCWVGPLTFLQLWSRTVINIWCENLCRLFTLPQYKSVTISKSNNFRLGISACRHVIGWLVGISHNMDSVPKLHVFPFITTPPVLPTL